MDRRSLLQSLGVAVLLVAFFWGGVIVQKHISQSPEYDISIFWETWDLVEKRFPFDDREPDTQERIYAATAGMVDAFDDPHTVFLPPQQAQLFQEDVQGEFGGVGMEVDIRDELITVVAPLKDSPAEKAGILPGDVVIAVDETQVFDMDLLSAVSLIRGPKGEPVVLTLARDELEDPFTVSIVRDTIQIPTIEHYALSDEVYYIGLFSFTQDSPEHVAEALQGFLASGTGSLIFDLRSNPGGYLDAGIEVASMFLPEGKVVVHQDSGGDVYDQSYRSVGYMLVPEDIPILLLVDGGSASASEIVMGALVEHGRARAVGTQTFGKGSVQELIPLSDDSSLKVTIAQWVTPEGTLISEDGLMPEFEVYNILSAEGEFIDNQISFAQKLLENEEES